MNNTIKLSEFAANEWREYSLYTIEERAIPSMIDGFKPVHRFIMHSALKCANKTPSKVTAIAGPVAEYGYHHGEGNAQEAAKLMAADWCNNQPVLLGDGNFGDRLVPTGAAPRYIFAKVHPMFHKIYMDHELCPPHVNDDHIPPRYYLPIIPMVLVNGMSGIATGYATDILPYSISDIRDVCIKYISGKPVDDIKLTPKFYDFAGQVVSVDDKWVQIGNFELVGKTTIMITELPMKYDRESYIDVLSKLHENDTILGYEDQCDDTGFKFRINLKRGWSDGKTSDDIIKTFKLSGSVTENLTVLDENRKLRQYSNPINLIKDFCDFRMPFYQIRIDRETEKNRLQYEVAVAKIRFIQMVINQQIDFKGKSKADLTTELTGMFDSSVIPTLLGMEIYNLTHDEVLKQMELVKRIQSDIKYWNDATPVGLFKADLSNIK